MSKARYSSVLPAHAVGGSRSPRWLATELLEARQMLAAHILGSTVVYPTIQSAVNAAVSGATITVDAGAYPEEVSITKSLTIQGAQAGVDARQNSRANGSGANESIVTGAVSGGVASAAFYINANDVTIDGFTVQGETDQSLQTGAGIVIAPNRAGTHILNNIVQHNVSGLFLSNNSTTDPAVIQYNVFRSNNNNGVNGGRGIYTDEGVFGSNLTNVTIDSNSFVNNYGADGTTGLEAACAFEADSSGKQSNIRITNNAMSGNGKGVLFFNATNVLIEGNTVTTAQDQYSGTLRFEGNNQNVTIEYNNVYNNTGPAVSVDSKATPGDNSGFVVSFNNFYGNNNAYAVPISVVYEADVYDGTFDARNNWWGNASGPSGDGTGTGDAASAGVFQPGAGLGWKLLPGGNLLDSPWSTIQNIPPGILPTAPTGLSAVASGVAQVTLSWTDTAPSIEAGFVIQRSSDGVTFSQVGTTAAGVTRFIDTTAAAGTAYTYRVAATNANGGSAFSATAGDTTPAAGSTATNLSALNWVSATAGYGSVQKNLSIGGNPITLNGIVYATGIGAHAVSNIVYNLNGAYTHFMSDIGIDAEENAKGVGHVDFQVLGDGKVLYDGGVLLGLSAPVSINVNVTGVKTLTLVATNGIAGSIDYDHADWAGAQLIAAPAVPMPPAAPSGLIATATSATQINLTWTNTANNATGLIIQRSTDGVTFTQIATTPATATSYSDTTAVGATAYTYRVAAVNAFGTSAFSPAASVTTPAAGAITTYLSDLNWVSATTGYASVQKNLSVGGNAITLNGVVYPKGIGTHAVSTIVYNLGGAYTNFLSDIGVDSEELGKGTSSIDFKVLGDNGAVLYDSGNLTNTSATVSININVTGVKTLTLVATNGIAGSIDYDHADWAGARLLSISQPPAAPGNLVAVTSSATQVNLSWTNNAVTATGFVIQRATGTSGTYTQIGTTAAGVTTFFDKTALAGTSYTYQVLATNGGGTSLPSIAAGATTLSATAVVTNLSSLAWTSATTGYGAVQHNASVNGNTLSLRGVTYATGIGAHAVSNIVYNLAGGYTSFISDVGVDDEVNGAGVGSVDFQVYGDGKLLFDSGPLSNTSPIVSLDLNVVGVKTLTLVATNGVPNSIDYDHADWAGARFVR